MSRLTKRDISGACCIPMTEGSRPPYPVVTQEAVERLAAYEDTGLEPEVVKDMAENAETRLLAWFEARYDMPVGKLMDLIEAYQDGRLVVLPGKASIGVWLIDKRPGKDEMYAQFHGEVMINTNHYDVEHLSKEAVPARTGRWIERLDGDGEFVHHMCSECKADAIFQYIIEDDWDEGMDGEWYSMGKITTGIEEHLTNCCPNCGAKMEQEAEE